MLIFITKNSVIKYNHGNDSSRWHTFLKTVIVLASDTCYFSLHALSIALKMPYATHLNLQVPTLRNFV